MARNIEMNYYNGSDYEVLWPENGCLKLSGGTMNGPIINGSGSAGGGNDYQIRTSNLGELSGIGHSSAGDGTGSIGIYAYNVHENNRDIIGTSLIVGVNNTIQVLHVESGIIDYPRITGLGDPTGPQDAVTKNYIDNNCLKYEISSYIVKASTTYLTPNNIKTIVFAIFQYVSNTSENMALGFASQGATYCNMLSVDKSNANIVTDLQINSTNIKSTYAISDNVTVRVLFIGK